MTTQEKITRLQRLIADKIVERDHASMVADRMTQTIHDMIAELQTLIKEEMNNE
jgi:hypothetical protein